jgi:hypothetical protein
MFFSRPPAAFAPGRLKLVEVRHRRGVQASFHHPNSFGAQAARLFAVRRGRRWEHDAASRTDHPVPGQIEALGRRAQRESNLPRATRQSRRPRDRSVRGGFSPRDRADHMPDLFERWIIEASRGVE